MAREPILSVRNLGKSFGDRRVLRDVCFDVYPQETLVVMGGSGSGKSTILKHMIGAYQPDEGGVYYRGCAIHEMNEEALAAYRLSIGILFQHGALLNSLSIGENIALPIRENTSLAASTIDRMVTIKLEQVGLLGLQHLKPAEISGGMRKRVSLARAIALDPHLLYYDEPSSGLDPIATATIDRLIVSMARNAFATNIVVTHDMASAFRIADRMLVVFQGEIIAEGTPAAIRDSDDPRVVQFINGHPDGPIPFRQTLADYEQYLLGYVAP